MPPVFRGPAHDSTNEDTPSESAPGRPRGPRLNWALQVAEERIDDVLVLVLTGRISSAEAERLQSRIDGAVAAGDGRLVIDLAGVDYVASRGIAVLDAAHKRLEGALGHLVLCEVADAVRIAIDLAGSVNRLPIERTRAAAAAAASRGRDTPSPPDRETA